MRPSLFAALFALGVVPAMAKGQAPSRWRFGVDVSAPTRLLAVSDASLPDSADGHSDLGLGAGATVERMWAMSNPKARWGVAGRLAIAQTNVTQGGATFGAGTAILLDVAVRVARDVGPRATLFSGVGVSHFAGPEGTAPFEGIGAALLAGEAGVRLRSGKGPWGFSAGAHVARVGPDDERGVQGGIVWRVLAGVTRDY